MISGKLNNYTFMAIRFQIATPAYFMECFCTSSFVLFKQKLLAVHMWHVFAAFTNNHDLLWITKNHRMNVIDVLSPRDVMYMERASHAQTTVIAQ